MYLMIKSRTLTRLLLSIIFSLCFFFQAEDGIRDLVRSRGLGDVYKRQTLHNAQGCASQSAGG